MEATPQRPQDPTRPGQGEFEAVAAHYDYLMRNVPYAGWVNYVQNLLQRWDAQPREILDLACGTGQVGCELLRRGYEVIGADLSKPMAHQCSRQTPPLTAVACDARELAFTDAGFDAVVCLYDSLNYILEPAGFQAALHEAARVLRPGGIFIFDLNTTRALATGLFTQSCHHPAEPLHYRWEAHWDADTHICRVDMWFCKRDEPTGPVEYTETHYQRAYSNREVAHALRRSGFARFRAYHAYTVAPLNPWSDRAYYVARKGS